MVLRRSEKNVLGNETLGVSLYCNATLLSSRECNSMNNQQASVCTNLTHLNRAKVVTLPQ